MRTTRRSARRSHPVLLLLAGAASLLGASAASGQVTNTELFYTRFDHIPGDKNIKKVVVTYDRSVPSVVYSPRVDIVETNGADGIIFAPDGDLLVGGQSTGNVHKIDLDVMPPTINSQPILPCTEAYHLMLDPGLAKVWVAGIPAMLAEMPLTPFGPGTCHALSGDNINITNLAFTSTAVYYTASNAGGHGDFGTINLTTFVTTRIHMGVEGFHGAHVDPFSGDILTCGDGFIRQINPADGSIRSSLDVATATGLNVDMDQCTGNGHGLFFVASNLGQLVMVDYAASGLIGTPTYVNVQFLDDNLDDIAPLVGPGSGDDCCFPWDNGGFDRRDARPSQLCNHSPGGFDYRTADDFYLRPGYVYRIDKIHAEMVTDSSVPSAILEVYDDCNGCPGNLLYTFTNPVITDTNTPFGVYRTLDISFENLNLWLRGGTYWVSFIGLGSLDCSDTWGWGTSGEGVVKGSVAKFKSVSGGIPNWIPVDTLCCGGCTDYNFCVEGEACKILLDNGTYDVSAAAPGSPSLDNGPATSQLVKTADNFAVPPCDPVTVCFIEAYILTNCATGRIDIYEGDCSLPRENGTVYTFLPDKVVHTGTFVTINNVQYEVLCLQFWTLPGLPPLAPGRNYWVSAYAKGGGAQNSRGWFPFNKYCNRTCWINFGPGAARGPGINRPTWTKIRTVLGADHDFAFLVAIHDPSANPNSFPGGGGNPPACIADWNNNGVVTVDDFFAYLVTWFAGCP